MSFSQETLTVLTFLIPGFLSSALLNAIVVRRDKDFQHKLGEALVFSFVTYAIVSVWTGESPVALQATKEQNTTTYAIHYNPMVFVALAVVSAVIPLVLGFFVTTDLHMRALRYLRITT